MSIVVRRYEGGKLVGEAQSIKSVQDQWKPPIINYDKEPPRRIGPPKRGDWGKSKYGFENLAVGDTMVVRCEPTRAGCQKIRQALYNWGYRRNQRHTTNQVEDGLLITRIA